MKIKLVVVDLELSKRAKRIVATMLVPILVIAGGALAYAGVPHTWANGDKLDATDLNANFANLDGRLSPLAAARGKASYADIGSLSIAPTTFTTVPYTTKLYDDRGEFSATSHAFTASTAGDYEICASLAFQQSVTNGELDVFINGKRERAIAQGIIVASGTSLSGCRTVRVASGDVIDVRVYHSGATTIQPTTDDYWDWITIYERR
jgi:hypothetical protein